MREPSSHRESAVLTWLLVVLGVCFLLQYTAIALIDKTASGGPADRFIDNYLSVTTWGLKHGHVWTLLTYGFLHADLFHVLGNALGLFLLGRFLLPVMGTQRFLGFFLGTMVFGGVAWFAVTSLTGLGGNLVGVSAVCTGMVAVFATLFPDHLLSPLFIPITIKPKHMAWAMAGVSLVLMLTLEITGRDTIAHSAHLGGMLAGWLYGRFIHHRAGALSFRPAMELPAWMRRRRKRAKAAAVTSYTVNVTPPSPNIKAEVDRILDKINSEGFGALTEEERRVLDEARDLLNRR